MSLIASGYLTPANVQEVVSLKRKLRDKALVVAGGTAAVQLISKMIIEPQAIISLEKVPLNYVKIRANSIEIGATTPIARLIRSRGLPDALKRAAESIHGLALKDMATVGGNIFTPAPAGDIATALLALDAILILRGGGGVRSVPLSKFYKGPLQFNIRPDEILTAVKINKPPKHSAFLKQTPWKYSGPTIASVSVSLDLDRNGKARRAMVALGGLTTHPYRAKKVEKMFTGKKLTEQLIDGAAQQLTDGVEVIDDALASSWYRRELAQVLFKRILYDFISRG